MLQKIRRTVAHVGAHTGPHANVTQTLAFIQAHQNINVLLEFTTSQKYTAPYQNNRAR